MDKEPNYKIETNVVHAGAAPDPTTGARVTPIYQTTAYQFNNADHAAALFNLQEFGNIYTRIMNPTTGVLEQRMATLEGGTAALAASSGHGAQHLVFHTLMEPGNNIVAARQLYGGSINQLSHSFKKYSWGVKFADIENIDTFKNQIDERTRAIFVESIANPGGLITDLEPIAKIAQEAHIPLVVDNTLATPILCQPKNHGANVITHSLTKFLGGHGNSMGGIFIDCGNFNWLKDDKFPALSVPCDSYHGMVLGETFGPMALAIAARVLGLRDLGPSISPFNAFQILTGMETLALRMKQHVKNALSVANFLQSHPDIAWVNYAGLSDNKHYQLAQKYCPQGAGSVFTFGLKGGYEAGVKLVDNVQLFSHVANIGDTRSLIIHPASTTHRQLTAEARAKAGAGDDVVRLSIGIEDEADLIADLTTALAKAKSA